MGYVEVTGRRMGARDGHEDIVELRCVDRSGNLIDVVPAQLVAWLEKNTNVAVVYTADRSKRFIVCVAKSPAHPPYVRARSDGSWTDHLLALPEYAPGAHASNRLPF